MNVEQLLTRKIKVNIKCLNGTDSQRKGIEDCEHWLLKVLNSREWREDVLYHTVYGKRQYLQSGLTNTQLLTNFIQGSERNRGIDYEADINIRFYFNRFSNAIAYVQGDKIRINLNTKYWPRQIPEVCNTIVHELCHLYGGTHSYNRSSKWPHTAPYFYGKAAQKWIASKGKFTYRPYRPKTSLWRRFKKWIRKVF
jgi:hypothetical protein